MTVRVDWKGKYHEAQERVGTLEKDLMELTLSERAAKTAVRLLENDIEVVRRKLETAEAVIDFLTQNTITLSRRFRERFVHLQASLASAQETLNGALTPLEAHLEGITLPSGKRYSKSSFTRECDDVEASMRKLQEHGYEDVILRQLEKEKAHGVPKLENFAHNFKVTKNTSRRVPDEEGGM